MLDQYLIELGAMLSRLEHKLNLKPMTEKELKHYLASHGGESFIKSLYKDHSHLITGKSDHIIGPDIVDFSGGNSASGEDQRVMHYTDLVSK